MLDALAVLRLLQLELIVLRLNREEPLTLLEQVRVRVRERLLELGNLAGAFLELPLRLMQLGSADADRVEARDELVTLALEVGDALAVELDELGVGVELPELLLLLRVRRELRASALSGVGFLAADLGFGHRAREETDARGRERLGSARTLVHLERLAGTGCARARFLAAPLAVTTKGAGRAEKTAQERNCGNRQRSEEFRLDPRQT